MISIETIEKSFIDHLTGDHKVFQDLTVEEAIDSMITFYSQTEVKGCGTDDGDMLMFQSGTFKSRALYHISRQLIFHTPEGEEQFYHLRLAFAFPPSERDTQNDTLRCSTKTDTQEFKEHIIRVAKQTMIFEREVVGRELRCFRFL